MIECKDEIAMRKLYITGLLEEENTLHTHVSFFVNTQAWLANVKQMTTKSFIKGYFDFLHTRQCNLAQYAFKYVMSTI